MRPIYWLGIFLILLLLELLSMGLTTIWFVLGALIACLVGFLGFGIEVQIGVFFVSSLCLLILTRPIASRYFNKERVKTNVESLIGEKAVVLEDIDGLRGKGRVLIKGQEWSAKPEKEEEISKEEVVEVVGIEGVKLIVRKEG